MTGPRYTPLVDSLPATVPFVGPETQERAMGQGFRARLGANESVFGPSPKVVAAMAEAARGSWMYGDPENHDLRQALAAHEGVAPENIIIGEGIDGLLGYLVRMVTAGPADHIVTSDGAYPTFNYHVAGFGGTMHKVAYRDDHEDPAALLAKAGEVAAKLIYFANPDNPMGSWHPRAVVEEMVAQVPAGSLLVLDEAYGQFLPPEDLPRIDPSDPRVIRFRTFSKAYGMAGARVGYGIAAPELITAFNKVRNHFGMSRVSQAGACAALDDGAYLADTIGKVRDAVARIGQIAAENGLTALPSAANFVAIDCGRDGAFAKAVLDGLVARGIFVRMPFVAPQNRCIRISAGEKADLEVLAQALPDALAAARTGV
ncbi:Histidinol-phosphate aminotransferase [Candidatus Rhodobacter oscarellae]|uniref:Histidinol-phosphate aminotransferase n=1 Tax=Candidatus Rhodobacter oscarellae TaxID=1675527 RepID=A0A0J9E6U5_9RHOB|nr:pyridoxal phosphate-dependent aminotransferase [Candidatus Rhodobacter lobularis]KMW58396.1 Histidinol-phosphate aminotransferase [Candidatus Rhodobacter lobularis]